MRRAAGAEDDTPRRRTGEKVTHRLAQESGCHKVIRYVRPVVKRRDTGGLVSAPAPANVLGRSAVDVDVSFLAGTLVDKFRYHSPGRSPAVSSRTFRGRLSYSGVASMSSKSNVIR